VEKAPKKIIKKNEKDDETNVWLKDFKFKLDEQRHPRNQKIGT